MKKGDLVKLNGEIASEKLFNYWKDKGFEKEKAYQVIDITPWIITIKNSLNGCLSLSKDYLLPFDSESLSIQELITKTLNFLKKYCS